MIIIVVGTLFSLLSYGAIKGVRPPYPSEQIKINYLSIKETIPWAFEKIGYDVFADFREKDISIKPSDFYKIEPVKKQCGLFKSKMGAI